MRATSNLGKLFSKFSYENNEDEKGLDKYLLNYGSYSFLNINKENKDEERSNEEEMLKEILSFSHNYELTLFDGDTNSFEKNIKEIDKKIFINIKLLLKRENNYKKTTEYKYENIKKIILNGIEKINNDNIKITPYYFISFDWFDLFVSLVVDIHKNINLSDLLSNIKEQMIVNNDYIHRSETEIFFGKEIIKLLEISNPKLQIRLASGHDSKILDMINDSFKNENVEINYLYGIRDIEIEYREKKDLPNLLKNLSNLLKNSKDNISDIQFIPSTPKIIKNK